MVANPVICAQSGGVRGEIELVVAPPGLDLKGVCPAVVRVQTEQHAKRIVRVDRPCSGFAPDCGRSRRDVEDRAETLASYLGLAYRLGALPLSIDVLQRVREVIRHGLQQLHDRSIEEALPRYMKTQGAHDAGSPVNRKRCGGVASDAYRARSPGWRRRIGMEIVRDIRLPTLNRGCNRPRLGTRHRTQRYFDVGQKCLCGSGRRNRTRVTAFIRHRDVRDLRDTVVDANGANLVEQGLRIPNPDDCAICTRQRGEEVERRSDGALGNGWHGCNVAGVGPVIDLGALRAETVPDRGSTARCAT
ncbi:MAG TPA: hypothetical protein VFK60_06825 [Casimicrobiaceae bacterium]|nr:hypothetical protein [Casimicrobiaceae bacterium]